MVATKENQNILQQLWTQYLPQRRFKPKLSQESSKNITSRLLKDRVHERKTKKKLPQSITSMCRHYKLSMCLKLTMKSCCKQIWTRSSIHSLTKKSRWLILKSKNQSTLLKCQNPNIFSRLWWEARLLREIRSLMGKISLIGPTKPRIERQMIYLCQFLRR